MQMLSAMQRRGLKDISESHAHQGVMQLTTPVSSVQEVEWLCNDYCT